MGVDTKGYIPNTIDSGFIIDHLKSVGAERVSLVNTNIPKYEIIRFHLNGNGRAIHFHYNSGILNSNLLSFGKWGESVEIMTDILEKFGGVLVPSDISDKAIVFESPQYRESDVVFLLKWGISKGIISDSKVEDVIKAKEAFDKMIKNS